MVGAHDFSKKNNIIFKYRTSNHKGPTYSFHCPTSLVMASLSACNGFVHRFSKEQYIPSIYMVATCDSITYHFVEE
jgi:hypothetical protein